MLALKGTEFKYLQKGEGTDKLNLKICRKINGLKVTIFFVMLSADIVNINHYKQFLSKFYDTFLKCNILFLF